MQKQAPSLSRQSWAVSERRSKITMPERANPLAKLVFSEMAKQRVTYSELEHRSNVLISTFKAWRKEKNPGLASIEAALGALGWSLVPVSTEHIEFLPQDVKDKLEDIGQHFRSDAETFGAAIYAAANWPGYAKDKIAEAANGLRKVA